MPHKIAATANLRRSPQVIRPNFLRLCPARNGLDQWECKIPFGPGDLILSGVGEAVLLAYQPRGLWKTNQKTSQFGAGPK